MTANDASTPESHPFLGRELRVELSDGRIIVGTLIAYEGSGSLLLQAAVEQRAFKDGEVTLCGLNLLAVPFQHIKSLHRRKEGLEPIVLPGNEPEQPAPALQI